jgi:hypothetical protein
VSPRVLDDARQRSASEIQSCDRYDRFVFFGDSITDRQPAGDTERLGISFESVIETGVANQSVEFFLCYVTERRMAEVMRQSCGFGSVRVDASEGVNI